MKRIFIRLAVLFFSLLLLHTGSAQVNEDNVNYVINRYIATMGGKAALERVKSVRLSGHVEYADGNLTAITVLKKKPDFVRVTLDTGKIRFIQAYNGETAWYARQAGRNVFYDRMRGKQAENFIRQAPLENLLVRSSPDELDVRLGEDVRVANKPCYQVIATLPDDSTITHYIEKETFIERRLIEYDEEGELISEVIPSDFETLEGVVFARKIVRMNNGQSVSTLVLDEVDVNIGILNTAFDCPVELPEK